MSLTYNPKKKKEKKHTGFKARMSTEYGRRVLSKRRIKNGKTNRLVYICYLVNIN